jgi:hypothetical protein
MLQFQWPVPVPGKPQKRRAFLERELDRPLRRAAASVRPYLSARCAAAGRSRSCCYTPTPLPPAPYRVRRRTTSPTLVAN